MLYLDEPSKVRMALLDAAEYMEKHGWCRGQFKDKETGAVCVLGAIKECFPPGRVWDAAAMMARYLGVYCVVHWNDDICRSKGEAVRALTAAASV